ncbi:hypothetical protein [Fulvitalea axinellae]|uniref:hypothetical protein n=1 Tax=Fulvitalea axinellae TaxID=1182444 RepID=UPI0030CA26C7
MRKHTVSHFLKAVVFSNRKQQHNRQQEPSSGSQGLGRNAPLQMIRYRFDKSEWRKGLEKRNRDGVKFFVSSLRHAIILPATYGYPHLTLDIDQTHFEFGNKGESVHVHLSQAHYSPAKDSPRLVFYDRGNGQFEAKRAYRNLEDILPSIQKWVDEANLPFVFTDCFGRIPQKHASTKSAPLPPSVSLPHPEEQSDPAFSDKEAGVVTDAPVTAPEEEPEETATPHGASPKATPLPRTGGRSKKKKKRGKGGDHHGSPATTKAPTGPEDAVAEDDPLKEWQQMLDVENLHEAVDTVSLDQLDDTQLKRVMVYFKLLIRNERSIKMKHGEEIVDKAQQFKDQLKRGAKFIVGAAQRQGRKTGRYKEAAGKRASGLVRHSQTKLSADAVHNRDFLLTATNKSMSQQLHRARPSLLINPALVPKPEDTDKFSAFQLAGLLALKRLGLAYLDMHKLEYFTVAYYFTNQIISIVRELAPDILLIFENLRAWLRLKEDEMDTETGSFFIDQFASAQDMASFVLTFDNQYDRMEEVIAYYQRFSEPLKQMLLTFSFLDMADWNMLEENFRERAKNMSPPKTNLIDHTEEYVQIVGELLLAMEEFSATQAISQVRLPS